jgi:hypothetical protein
MTTILVSTWSNGLFALVDGAIHAQWPGQSVCGLERDSSGRALAIIGGKSLCRRTAQGAWETVAQSELELSCCLAVGASVYVGTQEVPSVSRVGEDGSLERLANFDQVAGRDEWYAGTALIDGRLMGPPLGIRSMAATCDGKALLANVHVGGIPRSIDGGTTWQPTIAVDSDVHQVCAHPARPEIVIAATAIGLGISRDGGQTWIIETEGLHASYCSAVAFVGDDLLVAASTDHFAPQGAIYRRAIDGGKPLSPLKGPPRWFEGIVDTGNMAAFGLTLAVADHGGNLYLSGDCGQTWSHQSDVLPTPSSVLVY